MPACPTGPLRCAAAGFESARMSARSTRFPLPLDSMGRRPARASRAATTAPPPSGVGLDSESVRDRMVQRLCALGLTCRPVIDALRQVPRHRFVDAALVPQAYEDTSLPIGHGQTISKPSVVARMLSLLFEAPGRLPQAVRLGRVLEIGTGCGYQAALLSRLATSVISVER